MDSIGIITQSRFLGLPWCGPLLLKGLPLFGSQGLLNFTVGIQPLNQVFANKTLGMFQPWLDQGQELAVILEFFPMQNP